MSKQLAVWPNPTSSILNVELRMQNEKAEVQVIDLLGNVLIHNSALRQAQGDNYQIDVGGLLVGVYFVRVGTATQKFVKE